ncbi:MAG: translation initiation factor IF-3 [Planctomycetes bacterium]|nr:translation initiation factor IF-3 [Planctomycetota bacterium]
MNDRIRVREVRLIDAEGKQVGVVPTEEARRMASEVGLDLVEVAPDARPPVCKIMDYGKYKYEQRKKHTGKKPHHSKLKELRLRPRTDDHDYGVKMKHARDWLDKGDKVQIVLQYRGRELVHQEVGRALLDKFVRELADIAKIESQGRIDAKRLSVLLCRK